MFLIADASFYDDDEEDYVHEEGELAGYKELIDCMIFLNGRGKRGTVVHI